MVKSLYDDKVLLSECCFLTPSVILW